MQAQLDILQRDSEQVFEKSDSESDEDMDPIEELLKSISEEEMGDRG